jgi:2-polyprenyl-3-methyl-5-hydroxy-6-metoxy-1,4-benzoquinol methylase
MNDIFIDFKKIKRFEIDKIYKKFNFNPVSSKNFNKNYFKFLLKQRKNLFFDYLKLPLSLIANKSILEFGCASGEKSSIYAHYGCKLTLVDTNVKFLKELKINFKKLNLNKKIVKIVNGSVENFSAKKKYDFCFAENFLASTKNRKKNLSKLCTYLKPGGMLLITNTDPYGYFFDYLKSFILKNYLILNKIYDLKSIIKVAKQFFLNEFLLSKNTRNFEQFVIDQLVLNTGLKKAVWNIEEIIDTINKKKLRFYSSYPTIKPKCFWYKNTLASEIINKSFLQNYKKKIPEIIFSKTIFSVDAKKIKELMFLMEDILDKKKKIKTLFIFFKKNNNQFFKILNKFFKNPNPNEYKKIKETHQWGNPNFYLLFYKKN